MLRFTVMPQSGLAYSIYSKSAPLEASPCGEALNPRRAATGSPDQRSGRIGAFPLLRGPISHVRSRTCMYAGIDLPVQARQINPCVHTAVDRDRKMRNAKKTVA